jgi:hypothetical protein
MIGKWTLALCLILAAGCTATKQAETEPEAVTGDRFFILVLDINAAEDGTLSFTPIYEAYKDGIVKGEGPRGKSPGLWKLAYFHENGKLINEEVVDDPMQTVYEYSEDGEEITSVELKLTEAALAIRAPVTENGEPNGLKFIKVYNLEPGGGESELYTYRLTNGQ